MGIPEDAAMIKNRLHLQGLQFKTHLGVTDWERELPQEIRVDVLIEFSVLPEACYTDQAGSYLCYDQITQALAKELQQRHFHTIEFLAFRLWRVIAEFSDDEIWLQVVLTKLTPPLKIPLQGASFSIEGLTSSKAIEPTPAGKMTTESQSKFQPTTRTANQLKENNMTFAQKIKNALAPYSMLRHPFYQSWTQGTLSLESLQNYGLQYRPFVDHFPRYVAAILTQCEDKNQRRELLQNLLDEEGYPDQKDHPTLWKQFVCGIGVSEEQYLEAKSAPWASALHQSFWSRCRQSYHEGLGALFAYEHQIPEVAQLKIKGLKEHYQIEEKEILEFFTTHLVADVYHSESCENLLNRITDLNDQEATLKAAVESAQDLWRFLSECHAGCVSPIQYGAVQ